MNGPHAAAGQGAEPRPPAPARSSRPERKGPSDEARSRHGVFVASALIGTLLPVLALLVCLAFAPAAGPLVSVVLPAAIAGCAATVWALLGLHRTVRSLRDLSGRDALTGTYNRRAGEEHLTEDLARSSREGRQLTLAMIDADGLKQANDSSGHAAGDACLKHLAEALRRNVREGDWIARWGGDEFVVLLHDSYAPPSPQAVLERVARDLRERPVSLPDGSSLALTFSAGLSRSAAGDRPTDLLARADALLYDAKRQGRARIAA